MAISNLGVVGFNSVSGSGIDTITVSPTSTITKGDPTTATHLLIMIAMVGDYAGSGFQISDDAPMTAHYYELNSGGDNFTDDAAATVNLEIRRPFPYVIRNDLDSSNTITITSPGSSFTYLAVRLHHFTGIKFSSIICTELEGGSLPVDAYGSFGPSTNASLSSTTFYSPFGGATFDGTQFAWQSMRTEPRSPDTSSIGDVCAFEPPTGPNNEQHSFEANNRHIGYWFRPAPSTTAAHKYYFTPTSGPKTRDVTVRTEFIAAGPGEAYDIPFSLDQVQFRS